MKVTIERFGAIRTFSYDLDKDFIVTYGNNNIGKSYSMQIIYLLLKTFRNQALTSSITIGTEAEHFEKELKKAVDEFAASKSASLDVTKLMTDQFYQMFTNIFLHEFLCSCYNTFGNFEKTLEQNPVIHVRFHEFSFAIYLKDKKIVGSIHLESVQLLSAEPEQKKEAERDRSVNGIFNIFAGDGAAAVKSMTQYIIGQLTEWSNLIRAEWNEIYFLPASRSGIYSGMNAFGPIVAELSKNRAYITKKIEFPGISEPISDYFIALSNIKSRQNEQYAEYYSKIEKDILKGKITFDATKNALMYQPNRVEAQFEMSEVSSMVSEISPIVAFLKYMIASQVKKEGEANEAGGKSILFIEEPEAHLHPDNQIALIEIFSELIKVNIKLIISSHSNYVFNKLNNLVLSKKLNFSAYQPIVLEDLDGGSVSKLLPMDELGASDENFVDVSEKLYNEREEIIQKMYMEEIV